MKDDMEARITDGKQVLIEKFVSFRTHALKQCTYDSLEIVPEIDSKIKTMFLFPVFRPEIVLLIHKLEERKTLCSDGISAADLKAGIASNDDFCVEYINDSILQGVFRAVISKGCTDSQIRKPCSA